LFLSRDVIKYINQIIKSNQIYLPAQVQETMHNVKQIITQT